jgi:hypothetical protein
VAIPKGAAAPTGDDRPARQTDPGVGVTPKTTNAFSRAWPGGFCFAKFFVSQNRMNLVFNPRFSAA